MFRTRAVEMFPCLNSSETGNDFGHRTIEPNWSNFAGAVRNSSWGFCSYGGIRPVSLPLSCVFTCWLSKRWSKSENSASSSIRRFLPAIPGVSEVAKASPSTLMAKQWLLVNALSLALHRKQPVHDANNTTAITLQ